MMRSLPRVVTVASVALVIAAPAAAAPLIYEGTLTIGGVAPEPWPRLRFSLLDEAGMNRWSVEIDDEGPIEFEGDGRTPGRFVAYLEDSLDNPFPVGDFDEMSALRVEVCLAEENQGECDWLPLDEPQRIGAVPAAAVARLPVPPREAFFKADLEPPGNEENLWPYTEVTGVAPVTGLYLIAASYHCRSDCEAPGRYPHEFLFINDIEHVERSDWDFKMCNRGEPFEEKVFLPVVRRLDAGDNVRFRASGWSCNQYRYANLSLSPLSVYNEPPPVPER